MFQLCGWTAAQTRLELCSRPHFFILKLERDGGAVAADPQNQVLSNQADLGPE